MLRESDRAPGLLIGDGVELPQSVELGANVIVHDGTHVADFVRIQDNAVLGKPLALGARSKASRAAPPPLVVGESALIAAGAIVVAGAEIGAEAMIGDQAHVRERAVIGPRSLVGRGTAVDNDVRIGADVRIQTGCYITAFTEIEDEVFVGPRISESRFSVRPM